MGLTGINSSAPTTMINHKAKGKISPSAWIERESFKETNG